MAYTLNGPLIEDSGKILRGGDAQDITYVLTGSDYPADENPIAVRAYLKANIPSTWDGLDLDSISYANEGNCSWQVSASYRKLTGTKIRGTSKGGTVKRFYSAATYRTPKAGLLLADIPDFKGAISVQNGQVGGVDVPIEAFSFSINSRKTSVGLPSNYLAVLSNMTGQVNDDLITLTYKGQAFSFAGGELRFDGLDWTIDENGILEMDLDFTASRNAANLVIGDITVPAKLGHEFLWLYYRDVVTGNDLAPQPTAAYVEVVHVLSNFSVFETI